MSKLEERENRRRSIVGGIINSTTKPTPQDLRSGSRGRPKEDRELKKRVSLSVLPSLYDDIQKIAYVQRRSTSDLLDEIMQKYREENLADLKEYERLKR